MKYQVGDIVKGGIAKGGYIYKYIIIAKPYASEVWIDVLCLNNGYIFQHNHISNFERKINEE